MSDQSVLTVLSDASSPYSACVVTVQSSEIGPLLALEEIVKTSVERPLGSQVSVMNMAFNDEDATMPYELVFTYVYPVANEINDARARVLFKRFVRRSVRDAVIAADCDEINVL